MQGFDKGEQMAKYVYPAIFTPENGGYDIRFPDLTGCYTCGDDLADGLAMAADVLSLTLVQMEDEKKQIPEPSSINDLSMEEFASLISADTIVYRRTLSNTAIKKTLSIPQYLNQAAIAAGLNFSQVLQEALKERLHLA